MEEIREERDRPTAGGPQKENRKKRKKEPKKSIGRELLEDVALILVVLAAVFLMKQFVLMNVVIPSGSMEDTIMTGDRIFGSRLSYEFGDPQRGDIVIFRYPDNEEELFIKRVIGLPGEKVEIIDGKVYINDSDQPLEEDYLKETPIGSFGPYYVPEGCYFMMGDNRNDSRDSRWWDNTYVERDKILAKAVWRYWPLAKFGKIE
ncbi:MAG TPA: signal peptidase I [Candidatus Pullilachnospira intestinigallinarum]|nr:signal peptidase I [Candidatus Pullilachnospira intestinigallinarum]